MCDQGDRVAADGLSSAQKNTQVQRASYARGSSARDASLAHEHGMRSIQASYRLAPSVTRDVPQIGLSGGPTEQGHYGGGRIFGGGEPSHNPNALRGFIDKSLADRVSWLNGQPANTLGVPGAPGAPTPGASGVLTSPVDVLLTRIEHVKDDPERYMGKTINELHEAIRKSAASWPLTDVHRLLNAVRQLVEVASHTKPLQKFENQARDMVRVLEKLATQPRGQDRANWIAANPYKSGAFSFNV